MGRENEKRAALAALAAVLTVGKGNVWRRFQWKSGCFADAEAAPPRRHFYLNAKMCFNRFSIQQLGQAAGSCSPPARTIFHPPACIIDDTRASPLQPSPANSSPALPGQAQWADPLIPDTYNPQTAARAQAAAAGPSRNEDQVSPWDLLFVILWTLARSSRNFCIWIWYKENI